MPDAVDTITAQLRSSVAAALAETVAAEKVAARAAELERVRQVANKLLEESRTAPAALTAAQAFDELFRRLATDAPLPAVLNRPDERAYDAQRLADVHGGLPLVGVAGRERSDAVKDLDWSRARSETVGGGTEPGGPFDDNSPEAIGERARLELERREQ